MTPKLFLLAFAVSGCSFYDYSVPGNANRGDGLALNFKQTGPNLLAVSHNGVGAKTCIPTFIGGGYSCFFDTAVVEVLAVHSARCEASEKGVEVPGCTVEVGPMELVPIATGIVATDPYEHGKQTYKLTVRSPPHSSQTTVHVKVVLSNLDTIEDSYAWGPCPGGEGQCRICEKGHNFCY